MKYVYPFRGLLFVLLFFLFLGGVWNLHSVTGYAKEEQKEEEQGEELTEEEEALKAAFGLDNEQIMWRRWCIRNNCNNDIDLFHQEYPSTPEEAFIATGAGVFDNKAIIIRLRTMEETPRRGRFTYTETQERLDLIRSLETKYGKTSPEVLQALEEKKARLQELENYDELREQAEKELEQAEAVLKEHSEALSAARKQFAGELVEKIADGLRELNFLDVQFEMEFRRLDHFTAGGIDEPEFLISTNPGEPVRPLGMVASGGELSRIMLAIKTVLAETDQVPTLIFDEIDTGISGRTAQMVSEKLRILSKCRQVICITHLPQIAAMADQHFEIRKSASDGRTATSIRALDREAMVDELARLLGGAEITETVRQNAEEMKKLAKKRKLEV